MKVVIFLLFLALSSSYAANVVGGYTANVVGGYTRASANDPQIKSLANYGGQAVVAKARADHKLSNSKDTFRVYAINSVYSQVVSGMNYKYDVKIVNSDSSIIINAKYIVYYQSWTNTKQVTIVSYDVVKNKKNGNIRGQKL